MNFTENLQKFLPFGYLFLVVLGILKESIFYYQIGINILRYSTIMDILISPIADLTSHPMVMLGFVGIFLILYSAVYVLTKNYKKEWVRKIIGSRESLNELTANEVRHKFGSIFMVMLAFGLFSFFLGIGLGNGMKVAKKIANDDLKYAYTLTYTSNETKEIY
jgi:uncharacterized membrane protein YfcA